MQRFLSHVFWTCPVCEHANSQEIEVPELDFAAEKTSDMGNDDAAELTCEGCETSFLGHMWSDTHEVRFEMEEPSVFEVQGDMPMYEPDLEDFYSAPPPDHPYAIAKEALSQLETLINESADTTLGDPQFRNRLVFSGAVAVLEAYLGDTIRNAVKRDKETLVRFATTNAVMKKKNLLITMSDVQDSPDLLKQTVEDRLRMSVDENLRAVLYHDIPKVIDIYRSALAIELAEDDADRKKLISYMRLRHDCVHRNGTSPEGKKHTDFTAPFVQEAVKRIRDIIDFIEDQVSEWIPF